MFEHQGIWLPDGEKHFPDWMTKNGEIVDGRGTYQIKKLRKAMEYVKQFRCAIDVGAHVGLWSMQLAKQFRVIHAFEPVQAFRACYDRNVTANGAHVLLYPCALGAQRGQARMRVNPADTGGTHIAEVSDEGDVEMRRLDDFDFDEVDFIKIDCEGYEEAVLLGAKETLMRWEPCVIVEQKPHKLSENFGTKGTPAVDLLLEMGARVRAHLGGDYVMAWP